MVRRRPIKPKKSINDMPAEVRAELLRVTEARQKAVGQRDTANIEIGMCDDAILDALKEYDVQTFTNDEGDSFTAVRPSGATYLDDIELRKALTTAQWNAVSSRTFDKAKVQRAVELGKIPIGLIKKYTKNRDDPKPSVRVTIKNRG